MKCPKCGDAKYIKHGIIETTKGRRQRYMCPKGHTYYADNDKVSQVR